MLVLERNQSWGPLLILFLFFWGFRSFPFIYLHSTGITHYTNKVFFSKTVFLPGKPITYVHYKFSPFFDVICTFMFQKFMSRHCFICLVLFLDLSIPVPMLTISYQILYCQSVNQVHTVKISGTLLRTFQDNKCQSHCKTGCNSFQRNYFFVKLTQSFHY